jgi:hypothetical protein
VSNIVSMQAHRNRRIEATLHSSGVTLLAEGGIRLAAGTSMADLVFASRKIWPQDIQYDATGPQREE